MRSDRGQRIHLALVDFLSDAFSIAPEVVSPEARLVEDLGLDSVSRFEMAVVLEDALAIRFPPDLLGEMTTIQDVIDWAAQLSKRPEP
jgi:acyl carrier protein